MRYCQENTLTATSGAIASIFFRAGSIFDPYQTGVGHQPMGHDQWIMFYDNYIVERAVIRCEFTWLTGSGTGQVVGVALSDDTTTSTAFDELKEQGKGVQRLMSPTTATGTTVVTVFYNAKNFHNVSNLRDNFGNIGAPFGSNPTSEAIAHVYMQPVNKSTTATCEVVTTIDYYCILSEPKDLGQS